MHGMNVQKLLNQGIAAAKAIQDNRSRQQQFSPQSGPNSVDPQDFLTEHAYQLLVQVTELDENNIQAWLWLSAVVNSPEEKLVCLNNVLALDPENQTAKSGLTLLDGHVSPISSAENLSQLSATYQHPPKSSATQPLATGETCELTNCSFCEVPVSSTEITCPACSLPLIVDCPACNASSIVEWEYCTTCGFEMGNYQFGAIYFAQLATAYQLHQNLSKAVAALDIAEKMMPDLPDLQRFKGEIQAELGQTDAAIATLNRAVELEPDQAGPYLMLGKVLEQEGRREDAEEVYQWAIKAVLDSSETHFAMGNLLLQQERFREAWEYLKKTIRLDPQHGQAWITLAQLYEAQQNAASAIRAYRRAIIVLDDGASDKKMALERLESLQL